jgi:hypothetical protein
MASRGQRSQVDGPDQDAAADVDGRVGQRRADTPADSAESAVEWGRRQAAQAPRWSADKRRRMAVLLGLTLPDWCESDDEPDADARGG